ncbi:MAG: hypothetical protein HHAS10_11760 [Candidatus Altimarinota bacterium]
MRNFFTRVLFLLVGVTSSPLVLLAADVTNSGANTQATPKIHHFSIITVPTTKVGEAIDVTVEARDKDDKVFTGYRGSIFFQSDTDFGASLPAQGKAIQFKENDNGVKTFSKGVTFKRVGKQELAVTEATEDVGGSITITIEEATTTQPVATNEPVTITVPEQGSTVTTDTIMVSGKTKKNSNVSIKFNGKDSGTAKTDDAGIYTYKLSGISQQSNLLSVSVLDGTNNVIGTAQSQFNYAGKMPTYFNTSIKPGLEVVGGTGITITVDAEPGLTSVSILIDGTTLPAKEESPGKYTVSTVAPSKTGSYAIEVSLKNILAQATNKPDAAILKVIPNPAPIVVLPPIDTGALNPPAFKNVVTTMEGTKVNLNFSVENLPANTSRFKIVYGDTPDTLSNEVLTYTLDKITRPNGTYNWYINNLPPKNYSFKIFGVAADGSLVSGLVSDPVSMTVGKSGACSIGNVSSVKALTLADKTILSWDALSGAISYNVYKINAAKDLQLIQNVKENSYTIQLSSGSITYADFAIKALCDEKTESTVPAMASKVQTGPNALALIVIVAALGSVLLLRRKLF